MSVQDRKWKSAEYEVVSGEENLTVRLVSPPQEALADDPLLLLAFVLDRNATFDSDVHFAAVRPFLERGHRVLSFDMPSHGDRINRYGEQIWGWRNAFMDGTDPFRQFLRDSGAVIDDAITKGIGKPGKIIVCGSSRAGYMALRLMAADDRIAAAAAFHPVTDWRLLTEFAADKHLPEVEALRIHREADKLSGRYVYLAIPFHDRRVGTASCCQFYLDLLKANVRRGLDESIVDFISTPDENGHGHGMDRRWFELGGTRLLQVMESGKTFQ